jgi:type IV pilus assembly protein PilV
MNPGIDMDVHNLRSARVPRRLRASAGFSMIEVMVAIVVLSLGLLGMSALMATSLRNGQSANMRTQATNKAYDIVDMMRSNVPNLSRYRTDLAAFTDHTVCAAAVAPRDYSTCANKTHRCDIDRWEEQLCRVLPNGRGRIAVAAGGTSNNRILITVDICWSDDRTLVTTPSANCDATGETRLTYSTGL